MANPNLTNENYNRFYLNMLADNVLIIRNALSPEEITDAKAAKELADRLDALADIAGKTATPENNKLAFEIAQEARRFFLHVLNRMLTENFHVDLKFAAVNTFVSEAEKYLDVLDAFMNGRIPEYDPIREEIFWLPVFTIQSRYIADNVGYYQMRNRQKATDMADVFNEYGSFSVQLQGMKRAGEGYRVLADSHHVAVADVLREFYEFLTSIVSLLRQKRAPGSLSLLYLDRARRMVCFYLMQWSTSINETLPDCDPYARRSSVY
jgi:hypothetical protein